MPIGSGSPEEDNKPVEGYDYETGYSRPRNRSPHGDGTYAGVNDAGEAQWKYGLDSEFGLYNFGDKTFSPKQFGELDEYEMEYLTGLSDQAMGHTQTDAQKQIERNTRIASGAMQGLYASSQSRNAASALRMGREGAEMTYAQGQEALGQQKAQDMQQGEDMFRQAALGKISGSGMQAAQRSAANKAAGTAAAGAGIAGLATIIAAFVSDERLKSDVSEKKGKAELRDMLKKMKPVNYDMGGKNESGILAQDLERSEAGREMVKRGPAGLRMVDTNEASKKMLAAMALMHEDNESLKARLAKLEGKKGRK